MPASFQGISCPGQAEIEQRQFQEMHRHRHNLLQIVVAILIMLHASGVRYTVRVTESVPCTCLVRGTDKPATMGIEFFNSVYLNSDPSLIPRFYT